MIKTLARAAVGLALSAGVLAGASAPALAATESQTFWGFGGSSKLVQAIGQAERDAYNKAADAHATDCVIANEIIDDEDPYFFVVIVELVCYG